jgi:hypothetical protein
MCAIGRAPQSTLRFLLPLLIPLERRLSLTERLEFALSRSVAHHLTARYWTLAR